MAGNALEKLLRQAGRELGDWQVARFYKIPEELSQTPCDFIGHTVTGRCVMIEAKMVKRASLPIGGSPGLQPHQFNALNTCHKAGGLSIVCWAREGVCAALTFDMVLAFSEGRRSIPWSKIEEKYLHSMDSPTAHLALLEPWLSICSS